MPRDDALYGCAGMPGALSNGTAGLPRWIALLLPIVVVLFAITAQVCCSDEGSCTGLEKRGPYRRESSNALEFRLLVLQLLQLIVALIGKAAKNDDGPVSGILLTIVGIGVYLVGATVVHGYYKKYQDEKQNPEDKDTELTSVQSAVQSAMES